MRLLIVLFSFLLGTSSAYSVNYKESYQIKFAVSTIDRRYFEGSATCIRSKVCEATLSDEFKLTIIDNTASYEVSFYEINTSGASCCSFSNGRSHMSFPHISKKEKIPLFFAVSDDQSAYISRHFGELYIMILD